MEITLTTWGQAQGGGEAWADGGNGLCGMVEHAFVLAITFKRRRTPRGATAARGVAWARTRTMVLATALACKYT